MLITMLDRLGQADRLWNHRRGTPPFARQDWPAIGPHEGTPPPAAPTTPIDPSMPNA